MVARKGFETRCQNPEGGPERGWYLNPPPAVALGAEKGRMPGAGRVAERRLTHQSPGHTFAVFIHDLQLSRPGRSRKTTSTPRRLEGGERQLGIRATTIRAEDQLPEAERQLQSRRFRGFAIDRQYGRFFFAAQVVQRAFAAGRVRPQLETPTRGASEIDGQKSSRRRPDGGRRRRSRFRACGAVTASRLRARDNLVRSFRSCTCFRHRAGKSRPGGEPYRQNEVLHRGRLSTHPRLYGR